MERQYLSQKNIYLSQVDSTNSELFRLIKTCCPPEGTVLWTDHQYAGRGLGKNTWESAKGMNIIASFLLCPVFLEPEKQFYLVKTISLSVYDAVTDILKNNFKIEIKWPNDILVNGKKIAGILIENIIEGSTIKYSVAGIGINANQTRFGNLQSETTSLKILTGKNHNIPGCINILSINIQRRYMMLKNDFLARLDKDYFIRFYRHGKKANYQTDEKFFEATIRGVDKYGKLLLETENGEIEAYDFKEVRFID